MNSMGFSLPLQPSLLLLPLVWFFTTTTAPQSYVFFVFMHFMPLSIRFLLHTSSLTSSVTVVFSESFDLLFSLDTSTSQSMASSVYPSVPIFTRHVQEKDRSHTQSQHRLTEIHVPIAIIIAMSQSHELLGALSYEFLPQRDAQAKYHLHVKYEQKQVKALKGGLQD